MRIVGGLAKSLGLSVVLSGAALAQDAPQMQENSELFNWKFQPPIGLSGRYTTFTRTRSSRNIPAMPTTKAGDLGEVQRIEADEWQTLITDYETISRDLAGNTVSRLIYRGLKQTKVQKINGKVVPAPNTSRLPKLEQLFAGLQIDIKQTPEGRILNVMGLDIMRRRFKRVLAQHSAADAEIMKARYQNFCDEKILRRSWDDAELRPPMLLRVGEGWHYQQSLELLSMKLSARGTRRLSALDSTLATISGRGNLTLANDAAQIQLSDGTRAGSSVVNRETGMEIDTYFTQRLALVAEVRVVEAGRILKAKVPQWYLWQSHRVFRANPKTQFIR